MKQSIRAIGCFINTILKIKLETQTFSNKMKKATEAALWTDVSGVLRGLNMIVSASQSLSSQRAILPTRRVSKAQRLVIEK